VRTATPDPVATPDHGGHEMALILADALGVDGLGQRIEDQLARFLGGQLSRSRPDGVDSSLMQPVVDLVLSGGKRLRAALCYWGWRGAGGLDGDGPVAAAAAMELLHAFALIHDDVMDSSLLRRGRLTVHEQLSAHHTAACWRGSSGEFGIAGAILAGDLCLVWADVLLRDSGLPLAALRRAAVVYDQMRQQTIRGQYLDLVTQAEGTARSSDAWRVARGKTAASTTTGPLLFGAALAGAGEGLRHAYTAYADPLGVAFQLRDDLLGAFGDPAVTGKPSGDDLRDGKCTMLLAHARETASPHTTGRIDALIASRSDGAVPELRELIQSTGARQFVENRIRELRDHALAALDTMPIDEQPRQVLHGLALALTTSDARRPAGTSTDV
jgi:geranylgeranyl diphosphate synthase type I